MKNLKSEVAAKYALIGIRPGKYNFKGFGEIDLGEITVPKADELYKRGFPHLKLRDGVSEPAAEANSAKARRIKKKTDVNLSGPLMSTGAPLAIEELRKNKKFINSLLTLEWKDLSDHDRKIFFDQEEYFQGKKNLLHLVSENDRKMQGLHAKVKAIAEDPEKEQERGEIINELSELEEAKLEIFAAIDTWEAPEPSASEPAASESEALKAKAAEEAIAKQKLIAANENYIYRNEPALVNMPETTPSEKKKKQAKADEIERRKQELISLGKPYERKSKK